MSKAGFAFLNANGELKTPGEEPIPMAIPGTVTVSGEVSLINANVAITGTVDTIIKDEYGFEVENTPFGEMRTIVPTRLVGASFEGSLIDSKFWIAAPTTGAVGGQLVYLTGSELILSSGTGSTNVSTIYSTRRARYVGGTGMRYRAVVQLGDIGVSGNIRRWGVGYSSGMPIITDGAWFQLSGTELSVVVSKAGITQTTVIDKPVTTGATTYEIYWTNSKVWFKDGDLPLHEVDATAATWADTMSFYAFMDSTNSAELAATAHLKVRTASIYRLGQYITQPIYQNVTGVNATQILKQGAGVLHRIIVGTPVNGKTISIYDNTAGSTNPIGKITLPSSAVPMTLEFGNPFFNGLNISPNDVGLNITVVYE